MAWLNTPKAIIERDVATINPVILITGTFAVEHYRRTIRWITTRYVGGNYSAACALRDALNAQYVQTRSTDPSVEAEVIAAGAGQYHVVATVRTISAWTKITE